MLDQTLRDLDQTLHGLRFPAERWRILAQADLYGVTTDLRRRIQSLPVRIYRNSADVAATMDRATRDQSARDHAARDQAARDQATTGRAK